TMSRADKWYACDTISERVFGEGLLFDFAKSLDKLQTHYTDKELWIRRSPGIAVHYAVKRNPDWKMCEKLIHLLSPQFTEKKLEIAKGYGWGIETIAKHFPREVKAFESLINKPENAAWLRYKYELGLKKAKKIEQKRS